MGAHVILSSWGFSKSRITPSVVVSGIWNNFVKLAMPIAALAILALHGDGSGGRTVAAAAGLAGLVGAVVVFALILRSDELAARIGRGAGRAMSRLRRKMGRHPVEG